MAEYVSKYSHLHFRYKGVLFDVTATNRESLENLNDYDDIRDDDVVVWTYPKSGTHLTLDISWKLMFDGDLAKYAAESGELWFETCVPDSITAHNPASRFTRSLKELSDAKSPRIIATHIHFELFPKKIQDGAAKVIYVSRNPKDICVSLHEMLLKIWELGDRDKIGWSDWVEEFLDGHNVIFGSWAEHLRNFYAVKDRKNIMWVKYEDLTADLLGHVQRISDFLGRQLSEETIAAITESCRFEAVKMQFPNSLFLRNGRVGGWKERFTVAQSERFDLQMRLNLGDIANEILK